MPVMSSTLYQLSYSARFSRFLGHAVGTVISENSESGAVTANGMSVGSRVVYGVTSFNEPIADNHASLPVRKSALRMLLASSQLNAVAFWELREQGVQAVAESPKK